MDFTRQYLITSTSDPTVTRTVRNPTRKAIVISTSFPQYNSSWLEGELPSNADVTILDGRGVTKGLVIGGGSTCVGVTVAAVCKDNNKI